MIKKGDKYVSQERDLRQKISRESCQISEAEVNIFPSSDRLEFTSMYVLYVPILVTWQ